MKKQFRKGVTSFYIVTFSTLILAVLAASFATIIVSELSRTANEDLSQSAYDAALAGIEDAKVAYSSYLRCVNAGATATAINYGDSRVSCGEIIYWMENPDCDMVGHILGRISKSENKEVSIRDTDSSDGDPINEAYTCAKISLSNSDYRSTLSSTEQIEVVKIQFDHPELIDKVKLSWYTNRSDINYTFSNFINANSVWRAAFQPATDVAVATPPTIEFQLVQTATSFTTDQLMQATTADGKTDRATLYLVPADISQPGVLDALRTGSGNNTYTNAYKYSDNKSSISSAQVAKTNDREISNKPFVIACDKSSAFACSVEIELPEPIGGDRSNETFLVMISIPYGEPDTDFALEYYCRDGSVCETAAGDGSGSTGEPITLHNAQVTIDSTGRANDLYRRIETRLITSDTAFAYPYYAIQILGSDSSAALNKNMTVKCESGLYDGYPSSATSPGCE